MMNIDASKLTPKDKALQLLFDNWNPQRKEKTVEVEACRGYVLSRDAHARYTLPVVRAAGMDAIVVHAADFVQGMPDTSSWKRGVDWQRADMGDDFDDSFDAAIAIENVTFLADGTIKLSNVEKLHPGDGVRHAGATVEAGELLFSAGTRLGPVEMGVLAAGGLTEVSCWKKPVVAVIPTGSELVPRGQVPQRGENIESNSLMLRELLCDMGAEPRIYPLVKDAPLQMQAALKTALQEADIVLVNAGSSKGEEDFSTRLLRESGTFLFHEVAAAPGRPMSIAIVDTKPVINLPGPPLAAFNGADWCVRAALDYYLGCAAMEPVQVEAVLDADLGAPEFMRFTVRMQVYRTNTGELRAHPRLRDGHSTTYNMAANGFYISPVGEGTLTAGTPVHVRLLRGIA